MAISISIFTGPTLCFSSSFDAASPTRQSPPCSQAPAISDAVKVRSLLRSTWVCLKNSYPFPSLCTAPQSEPCPPLPIFRYWDPAQDRWRYWPIGRTCPNNFPPRCREPLRKFCTFRPHKRWPDYCLHSRIAQLGAEFPWPVCPSRCAPRSDWPQLGEFWTWVTMS